jgi:hypothetical protein
MFVSVVMFVRGVTDVGNVFATRRLGALGPRVIM